MAGSANLAMTIPVRMRPRRLQEYKSKYLVLHDAVLKTYANEKALLARGRQLKQVRSCCLVLPAPPSPSEGAVLATDSSNCLRKRDNWSRRDRPTSWNPWRRCRRS